MIAPIPRLCRVLPPYVDFPVATGGLPVTDAKADVVISLPMHADLSEEDQDRVIDAIRAWKR